MRNKQQETAIEWITQTNWELAVTLTFHYDITEARANKTLRRWWNEIDRYFYGNAVKRQAKRTKRACLIEKGKSGTNYHYHIHAKRPEQKHRLDSTPSRKFPPNTCEINQMMLYMRFS